MLTTVTQKQHVPARTGYGIRVAVGDLIRITDLEGAQPVDFWAVSAEDKGEYLSCHHTKPSIMKLFPQQGDAAYTNRRRPIMTLVLDASPGQHDMQFAACDCWRYIQLGGGADHASCEDNLHKALLTLDLSIPYSPQPWNLFTNFVIEPDGGFKIKAPASKAGDHLVLRAEMDAFVAVSACPQDLNDTCGGRPTDILLEIGR